MTDSRQYTDGSHRQSFFRPILQKVVWNRLLPSLVAMLLNANASRCDSVQDYVNLAYNFHFRFGKIRINVSPLQIKSELIQLARLVDDLKPKAVLEIGTAGGGTLFLWCKLASEDATLISLDLPEGQFGGGYPEWKIPLYKKMAKRRQMITLLRENSHDPATLGKILETLNGREIDLLFIDGDHSYEGVRTDFEMYSRLVRRGGIIAFHDIVPHPMTDGCHVSEFWNEVSATHQHSEIVESSLQGWAGLGILFI